MKRYTPKQSMFRRFRQYAKLYAQSLQSWKYHFEVSERQRKEAEREIERLQTQLLKYRSATARRMEDPSVVDVSMRIDVRVALECPEILRNVTNMMHHKLQTAIKRS